MAASLYTKTLANDKFLDWSKLKVVADNNLNAVQIMISILKRVENQHFLLSP